MLIVDENEVEVLSSKTAVRGDVLPMVDNFFLLLKTKSPDDKGNIIRTVYS